MGSMRDTGPRSAAAPLYMGDLMSDDATPSSTGFALPTGTVTFVMTDIERSTRGWERSATDMSVAVARSIKQMVLNGNCSVDGRRACALM